MSDSPNSKSTKEESTLRDRLAVDRTLLANERTFLAYIRTALALFIAGVFAIKFFDSISIEVIGWIFILSGIIILLTGFRKYRKVKRQIDLRIKNEERDVSETG